VTLAALVQPRDLPSLDGALGSDPDSIRTPSPGAPTPRKRSPGKFFVLPAAGSAAARPGAAGPLASHPLNITMSPGSTDIDSPASSPLARSPTSSRFSPLKS